MTKEIHTNDFTVLSKLRNERFLRTIELCFRYHPFYKKKFQELNLNLSDIKSLSDIDKLPIVTKSDYMINPELLVENHRPSLIILTINSTSCYKLRILGMLRD